MKEKQPSAQCNLFKKLPGMSLPQIQINNMHVRSMLVATKVYCQRLKSILLQNRRQHRRSSASFNHKNRVVVQITKDCTTTLGIFKLREFPTLCLSRASLLGCSGSFGSFRILCTASLSGRSTMTCTKDFSIRSVHATTLHLLTVRR